MQQPFTTLYTGAKMPTVGLGTWKSDPGEVTAAVEHALDFGYRHIDCAAIYGNEKEVGVALTNKLGADLKREEVFVVSKLWNTCNRPENVRPALMESLRKLNLDYLDLYLIHWSFALKAGEGMLPEDSNGNCSIDTAPEAHFTNTWKALEQCVREGLVKHIGISNFNIDQIRAIQAVATIQPAVLQIECNPYLPQNALIRFCKKWNIVVTGYSPLGSSDRPWASPEDPTLLQDPRLIDLAARKNKTPAQICIRYLVDRGVTVIPKSVNPARIRENFDVFDFKLDTEDMETLNNIKTTFRSCIVMLPLGCKEPMGFWHPDFPWRSEFPELSEF